MIFVYFFIVGLILTSMVEMSYSIHVFFRLSLGFLLNFYGKIFFTVLYL